jgi:hypothetical protein
MLTYHGKGLPLVVIPNELVYLGENHRRPFIRRPYFDLFILIRKVNEAIFILQVQNMCPNVLYAYTRIILL